MRQAVVIGTTDGRDEWLDLCVASLKGCPVEVASYWSPNFELSVIAKAANDYDEFIFLPDSTEVLDPVDLVKECFGTGESVSLSQFPEPFGMYLGKYRADHIKQIGCPPVLNKLDAVRYETEWTRKYRAIAPYKELGNLPHSDVFVEKFGRLNMVCENRWLRRYKASWDGSTMHQEHQRIEALKGAR